MRDLARDLGLPLVVVARPGLGTINHTLLTLEAARAAGLACARVVLTPWPAEPTAMERSNRATIERLGGVARRRRCRTSAASRSELAAAGQRLRVDRARRAYARSSASWGASRDGVKIPATS